MTRVEVEFWHLVEHEHQRYGFGVYAHVYVNGQKESNLFFMFEDLNFECCCDTRRRGTNIPWSSAEFLWSYAHTEPKLHWIMKEPSMNWWVE